MSLVEKRLPVDPVWILLLFVLLLNQMSAPEARSNRIHS